jgi:sporulation protein YlmC with PRC-barrel domain
MNAQITDLFGLKIYSENGMYVGEVEDLFLDIDSKRIEALAVGSLTPEVGDLGTYRGVKIPFRLVKSISDVVVIRHIPQLFQGTDELK